MLQLFYDKKMYLYKNIAVIILKNKEFVVTSLVN